MCSSDALDGGLAGVEHQVLVGVGLIGGVGVDRAVLADDEREARKTVVMGKNTLLSLPGAKPLPDRRNLVVSTTMAPREGVEVARSIEEAAALAGEDAVLMGGAQLYRALLPRCERVLVTQVDAAAEGADAFFPNLDAAPDWTAETVGEWQEEFGLRFRYVDYVRRT